MGDSERYEYIIATVDGDELSWESKLVGNVRVARMRHDEDVSSYTERDIHDLTVRMFDVSEDQTDIIEVVYD